MMKKIGILLILCILLGGITGCSGFRSITPEEESEVRKAFKEDMFPSSEPSTDDLSLTFYGVLGDVFVFFWDGLRVEYSSMDDLSSKDYGTVVRYEKIEDVEFRYSTLRSLKVCCDGNIYGLTEAYEQDLLTLWQLKQVEKTYAEKYPHLYAQELEEGALSEQQVSEIAQLYTNLHGKELDLEFSVTAYLGSFGGNSVFFREGTFATAETLTVGKETFPYFTSFSIDVCSGGCIYDLSEAYEEGLISDRDLSEIATSFRERM